MELECYNSLAEFGKRTTVVLVPDTTGATHSNLTDVPENCSVMVECEVKHFSSLCISEEQYNCFSLTTIMHVPLRWSNHNDRKLHSTEDSHNSSFKLMGTILMT